MKSHRFAVGDRIEKFCKVCIEERGHVVASVSVRGRVSRMTCPTCGTRSSFKASLHLPGAHKTDGPVEHYDQAHTYRVRQMIMHPSYGPGEVIAVIEPRSAFRGSRASARTLTCLAPTNKGSAFERETAA